MIISENNGSGEKAAECDSIANVNGKNLFLSHGKAWHGKGRESDSLFDKKFIEDNFEEILYKVENRPCYAHVGGEQVQITGVNAVVMVSGEYEKFFESRAVTDERPIMQPAETLDLLETALSKFGAKFSSVGALYGGETFFVSAELPVGFQVAGDDHLSYLNATDNFTGLQRFRLFSSTFRVVCRNTARAGWQCSENKNSVNHTANMKTRLDTIIKEFECMIAAQPAAIELLQNSTKKLVMPEVFVNRVLDRVNGMAGLGINVSSEEMKDTFAAARNRFPKANAEELDKVENLIQKQIEKRKRVFDDILERYNSQTCETARGSAYSAYQSITEYANYGMKSKETARKASNDFMSLAYGKGATLTDAAWNQLASVA